MRENDASNTAQMRVPLLLALRAPNSGPVGPAGGPPPSRRWMALAAIAVVLALIVAVRWLSGGEEQVAGGDVTEVVEVGDTTVGESSTARPPGQLPLADASAGGGVPAREGPDSAQVRQARLAKAERKKALLEHRTQTQRDRRARRREAKERELCSPALMLCGNVSFSVTHRGAHSALFPFHQAHSAPLLRWLWRDTRPRRPL